MGKKLLTAADILAAKDVETRDVPCPEWDGTVRIKSMSGAERDAFESAMVKTNGKKTETDTENLRARLVAACAIDDKGELLFTPSDVVKLGAKSARALDRCFDAAKELSRIFDADVEDAKGN